MSPPLPNPAWSPAFDGATLGQMGEAGALIVEDEVLLDAEGTARARLTREEDPSRGLYALTYAVSGWLLYTRYLPDAAAALAAQAEMREALEALLQQLPADGAGSAEARRAGGPLLGSFLARYA
ncbi:hypothetical protein FGE12_25935 [Aggregicoccus sp. 17bor-14]|uniref:hypothetical protein n=1 Tax=Myxococcaceae TaxID=31 RepID=UPI00129C5996|nr:MULTISPECIES: hypothetical protein [Myxococcaceae]MBF5045877.1 hypothetical protein [Simulacricoccus sp. 17bor-14]MRI91611.1 hypothetical protein [Aggregicoccus sp. 17bor-14]